MVVKRVCVIGAGVSGLVAIKTCLEEGLEPVCFEKTEEIGGVWVWRDDVDTKRGSSLYESVVTNSSKEMMCFSDFPFPKDTPPYLPGRSVIKYYRAYAEHFKLQPHIQFNSEVTRVEQTGDYEQTGRWRVTVLQNGEETDHVFDAVMPATGFFRIPIQPVYPGEQDFGGSVIHSNEYRGNENYRGKNVVVVGGSHSAGDIAVDVSFTAKQAYLSMREGTFVVPRLGPLGLPRDMFINRRITFMIPEWYRLRQASAANAALDTLGLISERKPFHCDVMCNDHIQGRILCGKLKAKTGIDHFTRRGLVFTDGTEVEADAVIYATGYDMHVPFIDSTIVQDNMKDLELFKHVFPPRLRHPTLAMIGYSCQAGAHGPLFEMQSRWAVRVFKGLCHLPSAEKMLEDIRLSKKEQYERYGKHRILIPPVPYEDDLAARIGALPTFRGLIFRDPAMAYRVVFGPALPYTYRLVGPHKWAGAREACLRAFGANRDATRTRSRKKPLETPAWFPSFLPLFLMMLAILTVVVYAA